MCCVVVICCVVCKREKKERGKRKRDAGSALEVLWTIVGGPCGVGRAQVRNPNASCHSKGYLQHTLLRLGNCENVKWEIRFRVCGLIRGFWLVWELRVISTGHDTSIKLPIATTETEPVVPVAPVVPVEPSVLSPPDPSLNP